MLNMSQRTTIREKHSRGESVSDIARALGIDRKTVYRHVAKDDFSPRPPIKKTYPSKLDPYKKVIEGWLEEDGVGFKKQRHTNQRIMERLRDEHGFDCPYQTISDYIRKNGLRKPGNKRMSLELSWDPGIAQSDFGQADFIVGGEKMRCHYLVLSFPYSNMGYAQVFCGESAECFCQGLKDIFEHVGGVPRVIVFDNATGLGRRKGRGFEEGELFSRFRAHHRFESRYCNPRSGWEKGNAERKVAFLRNQLFVPVPRTDDLESYNSELLLRCSFQEVRAHYARGTAQGALFEADCKACLDLPAKPFEAMRYEWARADGWGHVTVDGNHVYSSVPEAAGKGLIVAVSAHKVVVMDGAGEVLAEHARVFSKGRSKSVDATSQLKLLARRPGGWRNSSIRAGMPQSVVAHLDAQDTEGLRRDLRCLYDSCKRSGISATMDALSVLADGHAGTPDFFQVGVLALRIADLGLDTPPVKGADLGCYDELFLKGANDAQ
jgi:transposase